MSPMDLNRISRMFSPGFMRSPPRPAQTPERHGKNSKPGLCENSSLRNAIRRKLVERGLHGLPDFLKGNGFQAIRNRLAHAGIPLIFQTRTGPPHDMMTFPPRCPDNIVAWAENGHDFCADSHRHV